MSNGRASALEPAGPGALRCFPMTTPALPPLAWAEAMAHALARAESRDPRSQRLLESGPASAWRQFQGRLGPQHLLALLLEDAAQRHPVPFDARTLLGQRDAVERLAPSAVEPLLAAARTQDFALPARAGLALQAHRLGVSARFARSSLRVVKADQQVLELPGTGGQLALHLALEHDLPFGAVFTVACASPAELALAGLAALECGAAPGASRLFLDPELARARTGAFDVLVGLSPAKGGRFEERQLAGLFPGAAVVLV